MTILDAAFWAVCLVLVASGATKVAEPESFAAALEALGIGPGHGGSAGERWPAVVVGVAEIGIGLNGLVLGGPVVAALAAVSYAAFTAVVLIARRRGLASCGCFGARSGTPSTTHAAINAVSAVVCAVAVATAPGALATGLDGLGAGESVAVVAGVLVSAGLIVVADTR